MFLHLGNGISVRKKYIFGIFDMDNATVSSVTRKYLGGAGKEGRIISVSSDLPKSFVVYKKDGKCDVYLSPLSTAALMGRID